MKNYNELNDCIKKDYFKQFQSLGQSYEHNFYTAFKTSERTSPNLGIAVESQVRAFLDDVLIRYANTQGTTKGGKIGRFLARIGSLILPFVPRFKK